MNEIESLVILSSIPSLGPIKIRALIDRFGTAEKALKAPLQQIAELKGFSAIAPFWNSWQQNLLWQQDLKLAEKENVQIIPFTSPIFPKSLLNTNDFPTHLYVKGSLLEQDRLSLAVIGTRNATIYGMESAETISQVLAENGCTIVSGLARGIDTAAHKGALKGGRTIAVIGSGLSHIYPAENKKLAEQICQSGALISQFQMLTPPDKHNFPRRNKIVSGLTLGSLLIEAPIKSGAMITMESAYMQKRKLFALPGRADQENFTGNHMLIKSGKAALIDGANDLLSHFNLKKSPSPSQPINSSLSEEEKLLLNLMSNQEMTIDELTSKAKWPVYQVQRILMGLLLKKAIKEFAGKIYKKTAA